MLRRALPLLLLVAATLTACDDPSNVGLGLAGGEGGQPLLFRTPLGALPLTELGEMGGGTKYVLAGQAADPLLGQIQATGYVDFGTPNPVGKGSLSRFREGNVKEVYLELSRGYLYGDTLSSVTFTLSPVEEEFSQLGAPSDTSYQTGSSITSFVYTLPDTLVKVPMPASWVTESDTTLRSAAFATNFHGFELRSTDGNAVIGFEPKGVRLFAVTEQDTVLFLASKTVSSTERLSEPILPPGYVLLQDGFPNNYRVDLKLDTTSVRGSGLNRLTLEMPYDSVLAGQTPPGFIRPRIRQLELVGVDEGDKVLFVGPQTYFLGAAAAPAPTGKMIFTTPRLTDYGQAQLLGKTFPVKSMLLRVPEVAGTLDVILLHAPGTAEAPLFALTVVPTD